MIRRESTTGTTRSRVWGRDGDDDAQHGQHDLLCQCRLGYALPGIGDESRQAYLPYGQEGVLVQAIKAEEATGLLATRYAPERYQEFGLP
jgi:hypothetical protein